MVDGVGQVPGKTAGGIGVALLARRSHIATAQMGVRVGHLEDVVRAMAVVAFGGLRITQTRNFAVVSVRNRF